MSTIRFLEYEVALLLAEYGKEAVLIAFAQKLALSQPELESILNQIEKEKPGARRARKPAVTDPIEAAAAQHPEKAGRLRIMGERFQNRLFLPELRDVKRFFEQHTQTVGRIKSRQQALPKLLSILADLGVPELDALVETRRGAGYSSLGVISDAILRRDG